MTSPPGLVVGLGCRRNTPVDRLRAHLLTVLDAHGLVTSAITALVSVEAKADEPGLLALAADLGVPLRTYPAAVLDAQDLHGSGSAVVAAAVGTRSVAEAAVLAHGATVLVPPHRDGMSTVAIGQPRRHTDPHADVTGRSSPPGDMAR